MIRSNLIYSVTFAFIIMCFFACKQSTPQTKELEALHKTVMSIHDDVMPKINTIRKYSKNIRKNGDEKDFKSKIMVKRLEQEEDAMMKWMQQYKKPNFKNYDEAKAYLLDQKIKIEKVRNGMLTVIDDSEKFLNK